MSNYGLRVRDEVGKEVINTTTRVPKILTTFSATPGSGTYQGYKLLHIPNLDAILGEYGEIWSISYPSDFGRVGFKNTQPLIIVDKKFKKHVANNNGVPIFEEIEAPIDQLLVGYGAGPVGYDWGTDEYIYSTSDYSVPSGTEGFPVVVVVGLM